MNGEVLILKNEVYNYVLEYQCYQDVEVIQKKGTVVLLRRLLIKA
jgi:hypothetical protein